MFLEASDRPVVMFMMMMADMDIFKANALLPMGKFKQLSRVQIIRTNSASLKVLFFFFLVR